MHRDQEDSRARSLGAHKMELVGRLAQGVAHDVNNLLTVILSVGSILAQDLGSDARARSDMRQILDAARRAAFINEQLLAFARARALHPEVIDLSDLLDEMTEMLARFVGEDVQLRVTGLRRPALVEVDRHRLEQVILSLAINARDAMPRGGILQLSLSELEGDDGPTIALRVRDSGTGLDEATAARIFEPFFTTKASGNRAGLGLSMARDFARQSGGDLSVQSRPGAGATFELRLPRCAGALDGPGTELGSSPEVVGTILLVEDDAGVRGAFTRLLTHEGHVVLPASSGEEADEVARRFQGPVHLLLIDVVLPGMTGPEVAAAIRNQRADTKVVYMSGHSLDMIARVGGLEDGAVLIAKPIEPDELVSRIRDVLVGVGVGPSNGRKVQVRET